MASEHMSKIAVEVGQLWPESTSQYEADDWMIGNGRPRYSRHNIAAWLIHWHLFTQEAEHHFAWAELRADILNTIEHMPESWAIDFFDYYCVLGYEFDEIAELMDCKISTCQWYWRKLKTRVVSAVLDDRICAIVTSARGALPTGYAPGGVGDELPVHARKK